jgi:hypothetical protein
VSPWWRGREALHARLARETGLDIGGEAPATGRRRRLADLIHADAGGFLATPPDAFGRPSPLGEVGVHGVPRARQWDAVAVAEAPELAGDEARFVALPDGSLVAETDDLGLDPLADALEGALRPPYRAEAVRRTDGLWAVAARQIRVAEIREDVVGERVTLTICAGERALEVDGRPTFGSIPTLERLAVKDAVVTAQRLDTTLWEIEVTPL